MNAKNLLIFIICLFFSIFAAPANAANAEPVGEISAIRGAATVERAGEQIPAAAHLALFSGDVIKTAANARLQVIFADETVATIGRNSTFKLADVAIAGAASKMALEMPAGSFKIISGRISKLARKNFSMRAATATIGIRGTVFIGDVAAGAAKLACLQGAIDVAAGGAARRVGAGHQIEAAGEALGAVAPLRLADFAIAQADAGGEAEAGDAGDATEAGGKNDSNKEGGDGANSDSAAEEGDSSASGTDGENSSGDGEKSSDSSGESSDGADGADKSSSETTPPDGGENSGRPESEKSSGKSGKSSGSADKSADSGSAKSDKSADSSGATKSSAASKPTAGSAKTGGVTKSGGAAGKSATGKSDSAAVAPAPIAAPIAAATSALSGPAKTPQTATTQTSAKETESEKEAQKSLKKVLADKGFSAEKIASATENIVQKKPAADAKPAGGTDNDKNADGGTDNDADKSDDDAGDVTDDSDSDKNGDADDVTDDADDVADDDNDSDNDVTDDTDDDTPDTPDTPAGPEPELPCEGKFFCAEPQRVSKTYYFSGPFMAARMNLAAGTFEAVDLLSFALNVGASSAQLSPIGDEAMGIKKLAGPAAAEWRMAEGFAAKDLSGGGLALTGSVGGQPVRLELVRDEAAESAAQELALAQRFSALSEALKALNASGLITAPAFKAVNDAASSERLPNDYQARYYGAKNGAAAYKNNGNEVIIYAQTAGGDWLKLSSDRYEYSLQFRGGQEAPVSALSDPYAWNWRGNSKRFDTGAAISTPSGGVLGGDVYLGAYAASSEKFIAQGFLAGQWVDVQAAASEVEFKRIEQYFERGKGGAYANVDSEKFFKQITNSGLRRLKNRSEFARGAVLTQANNGTYYGYFLGENTVYVYNSFRQSGNGDFLIDLKARKLEDFGGHISKTGTGLRFGEHVTSAGLVPRFELDLEINPASKPAMNELYAQFSKMLDETTALQPPKSAALEGINYFKPHYYSDGAGAYATVDLALGRVDYFDLHSGEFYFQDPLGAVFLPSGARSQNAGKFSAKYGAPAAALGAVWPGAAEVRSPAGPEGIELSYDANNLKRSGSVSTKTLSAQPDEAAQIEQTREYFEDLLLAYSAAAAKPASWAEPLQEYGSAVPTSTEQRVYRGGEGTPYEAELMINMATNFVRFSSKNSFINGERAHLRYTLGNGKHGISRVDGGGQVASDAAAEVDKRAGWLGAKGEKISAGFLVGSSAAAGWVKGPGVVMGAARMEEVGAGN